tara:strand:- start:518 stop:736 length:219 start_codon:yes stop_codon:yes gene_type:complete
MTDTIDFCAVRLVEPPIVAVSAREGLYIAEDADGTVFVSIGPDDTPAPTVPIPAHMIRAVWRTLRNIDEGRG